LQFSKRRETVYFQIKFSDLLNRRSLKGGVFLAREEPISNLRVKDEGGVLLSTTYLRVLKNHF
jgi:hypothetical protein